MADDPTSPGTDGEGEPGEDGADAPGEGADGRGGPGDGRGGAADGQEVADGQEPADDRAPGDGQGPADGSTAGTGGGPETAVDATEAGSEAPHPEGRGDATAGDARGEGAADPQDESAAVDGSPDVPTDVRKYERFTKVDGAQYDRVNEFLRERTYVTAREWAMARLCADFRTETGVEMTKIGENLPELVPFMEDTYSPQAVNQARSSFEQKVQKAGATFLYGAMCDFFTAEELDELMYEVTEVAKFLLEVEGVDLTVEEELEAEDRISGIMREVREASEALRYEECPHCGEHLRE